MEKDDLYTPEEIAGKLKITKYTVYEMIKRGDLDAHRLGKKLRISGDQYELYLLRSKGSVNSYEAVLDMDEDGETVARVGSVGIFVNTELTGSVNISIRPEDIILSKDALLCSANNVFKGKVTDLFEVDGGVKVVLDIGIRISALITKKSMDRMGISIGSELYAVFKAMSVKVYK